MLHQSNEAEPHDNPLERLPERYSPGARDSMLGARPGRQASPAGEIRMNEVDSMHDGRFVHIVTLECKDAEHAKRCIDALAEFGRPDARAFNCISYEFGMKENTADTVYLIERWHRWQDLDDLLHEKVVPALPMYNQLLKMPFDPSKDTVRISLFGA
jgi:quinol monooxygenase YgiN